MKKKTIAILFLSFLIQTVFSLERFKLQYPVDYYITDTRIGYNIVLGGSFYHLEKKYGEPLSKRVVWENKSTGYNITEYVYSDFKVQTDNRSYTIRSFETNSPCFITSRSLKIGDSIEMLYEKYGKPSFEINTDICYLRYFDEISRDTEQTLLHFFVDENLEITKLLFEVETGV